MGITKKFRLITAVEAENDLGKKYFFHQKTSLYQEANLLHAIDYHGRQCFFPHKLILPYIDDLKDKLNKRFPELKYSEIFYDDQTKRMVIDGIFGRFIEADTDKENEDDLLEKVAILREWFMNQDGIPETDTGNDLVDNKVLATEDKVLSDVDELEPTKIKTDSTPLNLPEGITFIRVDTPDISGVNIKSMILMSLPSIAKFIGVKTDYVSEWVASTTFTNYVLSIHHKQIHAPEISGAWKKGIINGLTPFLPLEIIPEFLVAFRQSGRTPAYPGRAEQLYQLAKGTLEAVGLSIAGDSSQAAKELAKVSEGLGIPAADQVIEIFKRYESRPFQINTNKLFRGKVNKEGRDIKTITGQITLGVTERYPNQWLALGNAHKLPSKQRASGREVMRNVSPADSVGVTFSESHYLKDSSNMNEVIKTGKQGKDFYTRLKDVGLLDD
jgi:hypothetical protein